MTLRDPVAELWAASPRGRSPRGLTVPVKHPTGSIVWLSVGQWMTLLYVRRRRYRADTLARIGAATAAHPGAVTHRLDRLAQLGLVGRRSLVGRGNRTRFWPPSTRQTPRSWQPGRNVATSTGYAGSIHAYASRGGVRRSWQGRSAAPPTPPGGGPVDAGRRHRRPPRLVWESCPLDGGAARLVRWRWSLTAGRLSAVWDGICPRCGAVVVAPLVVELDRDRWSIDSAGDVLAGSMGFTGRRRPHVGADVMPVGPRLDRLRELAAEAIASGDLDADQAAVLGARWLGWRPVRIPAPAVLTGSPDELAALRSSAWSTARDWRSVRYSQPGPDVVDVDSSVRDSQPGPDVVDG